MIFLLRHSTKLHIFGARARTVEVISLTILAFSLAAYDSYHFVSLVLPWRLTSKRKLIMVFCAARGGALHALCSLGVARRALGARALPRLGCLELGCGGAAARAVDSLRVLRAVSDSCIPATHRALLRRRVYKRQPLGLFASVLQPLANAREKRVSLVTERRPVRGEGPLGADGCSSAARLVFVARAAGRYASHGLGWRQSPISKHLLGSFPGPLAENPESNLQWWGGAAGACAIGPEVLQ